MVNPGLTNTWVAEFQDVVCSQVLLFSLNTTANILAEYWQHFCPCQRPFCLQTPPYVKALYVRIVTHPSRSYPSAKGTNWLFLLHNTPNKCRKSKYKNYITSLRISTLKHLRKNKGKGLRYYNLRPKMSSCISDLAIRLLWVWQAWFNLLSTVTGLWRLSHSKGCKRGHCIYPFHYAEVFTSSRQLVKQKPAWGLSGWLFDIDIDSYVFTAIGFPPDGSGQCVSNVPVVTNLHHCYAHNLYDKLLS